VIDGVTTEIWYPAKWGSDAGVEPLTYDIRYALPESEQGKISDDKNPLQRCDCYPELPIDADNGPYPVVVFIHGTASWRSQSLTQTIHWASRGFVVVSSDHAGLWLRDTLALVCQQPAASQDLSGDTDVVLAALANPTGELEFLADRIDLTRVGISGHSAGGNAAASQADKPGVRVSIPMASGQPVQGSPALASSLLLGGLADGVVNYSSTQTGYDGSPAPKRLVGIENAGHLVFSDICELTNDDGQDILEVAVEAGVCGAQLAGFLFDCNPDFIDAAVSIPIVNHATTAVLEQVLKCSEEPDLFAGFADRPGVAEYQQDL
jgi:predicted dienelactone hydrolase